MTETEKSKLRKLIGRLRKHRLNLSSGSETFEFISGIELELGAVIDPPGIPVNERELHDSIITWLRRHHSITYSDIARYAGCNINLFSAAITKYKPGVGGNRIPHKYLPKIVEFIADYGYDG